MKTLHVFLFLCILSAAAYGLDSKTAAGSPQPPAKAAASAGTVSNTDSDGDGRIDYIVYFLKSGLKEREEFDYNRDGVMDDFIYYEEGIVAREEIDSNYDGKIDVWVHILSGTYIRKYERDLDGDGKPDVIKDYDKG